MDADIFVGETSFRFEERFVLDRTIGNKPTDLPSFVVVLRYFMGIPEHTISEVFSK